MTTMEDLRAVAYGHAVSSLGYEIKLGRDDIMWKDGKHQLTWQVKKQKDGKLLIKKSSREIKKHKHDAEGAQELGERELAMIDQIMQKAFKIMRINAVME
jgi:hypothetical protein